MAVSQGGRALTSSAKLFLLLSCQWEYEREQQEELCSVLVLLSRSIISTAACVALPAKSLSSLHNLTSEY